MDHKTPEQALEILARELYVSRRWTNATDSRDRNAMARVRRGSWYREMREESREVWRRTAAGLLASLAESDLSLTWTPDPGGEAARVAPPNSLDHLVAEPGPVPKDGTDG